MSDSIENLVSKWVRRGETVYSDLNLRVNYLEKRLFHDYEPTTGPVPDFWIRLQDCFDNISREADKKILFKLIPYIFYVGAEEFKTLYRVAYNGPFSRWLVDQINLHLMTSNPEVALAEAIQHTWFCPITDSLRINLFYHVNQIQSRHDYRPDWRSLAKFGCKEKIVRYIQENDIRRVVLLEDFVGSGSQIERTIEFVGNNLQEIDFLIMPLLICSSGARTCANLENKYDNVNYKSIIELDPDAFVTRAPKKEPIIFAQIRDMAERLYGQVSDHKPLGYKPYGPFGYRDGGGLLVMHTNTPDNSLPLLHYRSHSWEPIFPRHSRV